MGQLFRIFYCLKHCSFASCKLVTQLVTVSSTPPLCSGITTAMLDLPTIIGWEKWVGSVSRRRRRCFAVNHNHENRYRVKKSQSLFLSDGAPPPLQSLSTAADEKTEERPPAVTRPTCLGQRNAFFLIVILKGKPQMLSITMREDAEEISTFNQPIIFAIWSRWWGW